MPADYVVTLPVPTSANRLHRIVPVNGRARPVRSRGYKAWAEVAAAVCPRRPAFTGRVAVEIVLVASHRCGVQDVDNLCKPTLDLLRAVRVLAGDSRKWVRKVSAEDGGPPNGHADCIVVSVTEDPVAVAGSVAKARRTKEKKCA